MSVRAGKVSLGEDVGKRAYGEAWGQLEDATDEHHQVVRGGKVDVDEETDEVALVVEADA